MFHLTPSPLSVSGIGGRKEGVIQHRSINQIFAHNYQTSEFWSISADPFTGGSSEPKPSIGVCQQAIADLFVDYLPVFLLVIVHLEFLSFQVTIYECHDEGKIKLLQAYVDPDVSFNTSYYWVHLITSRLSGRIPW